MNNALAANHYVCDPGTAFADFAAAARDAGLDAVGITRAAVAETGVAGLARCLDDHGLAVSSLNSVGYFTHPETGRETAESHRLIDIAAALGADVLCVITGGAGDLPLREARARAATGFAELADRASAAGVTLGLEPIHPADVLGKGVVNSCRDALALVSAFPDAKLILDLYHSWWDPDLPAVLRDNLDRVALIQLCNVRVADGVPVGRDSLLSGTLDLPRLLPDLLAGEYGGTLEFEIFARDLRGRDPLGLVQGFRDEIVACLPGLGGRANSL